MALVDMFQERDGSQESTHSLQQWLPIQGAHARLEFSRFSQAAQSRQCNKKTKEGMFPPDPWLCLKHVTVTKHMNATWNASWAHALQNRRVRNAQLREGVGRVCPLGVFGHVLLRSEIAFYCVEQGVCYGSRITGRSTGGATGLQVTPSENRTGVVSDLEPGETTALGLRDIADCMQVSHGPHKPQERGRYRMFGHKVSKGFLGNLAL